MTDDTLVLAERLAAAGSDGVGGRGAPEGRDARLRWLLSEFAGTLLARRLVIRVADGRDVAVLAANGRVFGCTPTADVGSGVAVTPENVARCLECIADGPGDVRLIRLHVSTESETTLGGVSVASIAKALGLNDQPDRERLSDWLAGFCSDLSSGDEAAGHRLLEAGWLRIAGDDLAAGALEVSLAVPSGDVMLDGTIAAERASALVAEWQSRGLGFA